MSSLRDDLRYGVRLLLRDRTLTSAAVLLLALGIGASTAIYTVVHAVLFSGLPFKNSSQIMWVGRTEARYDHPIPLSVPDFVDYAEQNHVFENLAAMDVNQSFTVSGDQGVEQVSGVAASAHLFDVFGVTPLLGHTFLPGEDQPGHTNVAIVSRSLWERHFGLDRNIIGTHTRINGQDYTIVGVLGDRQYPTWAELWVPLPLTRDESARSLNYVSVLGQLRSGVNMARAQAEMGAIAARLAAEHVADKSAGVTVVPLHERQVKPYRSLLLFFMMAVGFVLLIASANVSNLLLARAIGREREIGLRAALGASRLRIIQQLVTESILLALVAGALGTLLAMGMVRTIVALIPTQLPNAASIGIDGHILGFTLALCLITGLFCGLLPALHLRRIDLKDAIQKNKPGAISWLGRRVLLRSMLISLEVALTFVLLAGAGLMVSSFVRLMAAPPGFNPANMLTFWISLPKERYGSDATGQFYQQLNDRMGALPGVEAVGVANTIPPSGSEEDGPLIIEERAPANPGDAPASIYSRVNYGFLRAMQVPLLRGRYFNQEDCRNDSKVAIVDNTAARLFGGKDPIGQRIRLGLDDMKQSWLVIGVVADTRYFGWDRDLVPETYVCSAAPARDMGIVLRTRTGVANFPAEIRSAVAELDKNLPVIAMETMDERLDRSHAERRFNMVLLGLFAGIGVIIAAVGVYAAVSYVATQRMHEMGIRMALGASRMNIMLLVVRHGMVAVAAGMVLGLAAALLLMRFIESLLYEITPGDPLTLTLTSVLLILIALAGCYVPAARAARVNPAVSLQYE